MLRRESSAVRPRQPYTVSDLPSRARKALDSFLLVAFIVFLTSSCAASPGGEGASGPLLSGQVVTYSQLPVAGASVLLESPVISSLATVTDSRGAFGFDLGSGSSLGLGSYLRINCPGFVPRRFFVSGGEGALRVLFLEPGVEVSGYIQTGKARVRAPGRISITHYTSLRYPRSGRNKAASSTHSTVLADGTFQEWVKPGLVSLQFDVDGYLPAIQTVEVRDNRRLELIVDVRRGLRLAGQVLDADLRPVSNANVTAQFGWHGVQALREATTDASGKFEMFGVPANIDYLTAQHPRFLETTERSVHVGELAFVTLRPGTRLLARLKGEHANLSCKGTLFLGGNNLETAKLEVKDGALRSTVFEPEFEAGTLMLDGFVPVEVTWQARPGTIDVGSVELECGVPFEVRVVDETAAPVRGAAVTATNLKGLVLDHSTTDPQGAATLHLPDNSRSIRISVLSRGFADWWQPVKKSHRGQLRVELVGTRAVEGRILAPDGSPLSGALVEVVVQETGRLAPSAMAHRAQTTSGRNGHFRVEGLIPDSRTQLRVRQRGYLPVSITMPTVPPGKTVAMGDISFVRGGYTVEGSVSDEVGKPVGATVLAIAGGNERDPTEAVALSDSGGTYALAGVPSGTYTLRCQASGYQNAEKDVTLPEDQDRIDFVLYPRRPYRGVVTSREATPLAGARVAVSSPSLIAARQVAYSGTSGTFTLSNLADAGPFALEVSARGYVRLSQSFGSSEDLPTTIALVPESRVRFKTAGLAHSLHSTAYLHTKYLSPAGRGTGRRVTFVNGESVLRGLPQGRLRYRLKLRGYETVTGEIQLAPETETAVSLNLRPASSTTVMCRDESGQGVAGAELMFCDWTPLSFQTELRTDAHGVAKTRRIGGGCTVVAARATGFATTLARLPASPGMAPPSQIKIILPEESTVAVALSTKDPRLSAESFRLRLDPVSGLAASQGMVWSQSGLIANEVHRITNMQQGLVRVTAWLFDDCLAQAEAHLIRGQTTQLTLELDSRPTIKGLAVIPRQDRPSAIILYNSDSTPGPRHPILPNGTFILRPPREGVFRVGIVSKSDRIKSIGPRQLTASQRFIIHESDL